MAPLNNSIRTQDTQDSTLTTNAISKGMNMAMIGLDKNSIVKKDGSTVGLRDWGYPGYLTEEEFTVFEQLCSHVFSERRDESFRSTVFSFADANEEKAYALCRWLRARKYDLKDTITMIEEATECTAEPRGNDFFPDPTKALSVESSIYIQHYPQLYYSYAKNGCPLFISQPGKLNIDAITCLTSAPNLVNYHWYAMMHEYQAKLKEIEQISNGSFKRYECVCILDLAGLTASKLGKKELDLTKSQAFIDSLCFPETLNKMVIVNAPSFFTFTWKIIRGWIDKRTSAKVEVLGRDKEKLIKKLSKFIEPGQIPSDYGGNGASIDEFLNNHMVESAELNRTVGSTLKLVEEDSCLISVKKRAFKSISVQKGKKAKLSFLTRTLVGCKIIVKESNTGKILATINAIHDGKSEDDTDKVPSRFDLENTGVVILQGNASFDIEFGSNNNSRDSIKLMMITKTFIEDPRKDSGEDGNEGSNSKAEIGTKCASICTGTFSPGKEDVASVKLSPGRRSKIANNL